MTDHLRRRPDCLDAETLAAFIDGRLDARDRAAAEAHLADCADCYEAFVETVRARNELQAQFGGATSRGWWKQPRTWYAAISAVAAVVAVLVWMPPAGSSTQDRVDRAIGPLVAAVGPHRLTEGRLSESFAWGPVPSATRGMSTSTTSPEIEVEARALQAAARALPKPAAAQARGVASLAVGDLDGAVQALREATATGDVRPKVDLSAVLLERWRYRSDRADAEEARRLAGEAVVQDPSNAPGLFNLGLAAEALGQYADALEAWKRYQTLDTTSAWSAEARARAKALADRR